METRVEETKFSKATNWADGNIYVGDKKYGYATCLRDGHGLECIQGSRMFKLIIIDDEVCGKVADYDYGWRELDGATVQDFKTIREDVKLFEKTDSDIRACLLALIEFYA